MRIKFLCLIMFAALLAQLAPASADGLTLRFGSGGFEIQIDRDRDYRRQPRRYYGGNGYYQPRPRYDDYYRQRPRDDGYRYFERRRSDRNPYRDGRGGRCPPGALGQNNQYQGPIIERGGCFFPG